MVPISTVVRAGLVAALVALAAGGLAAQVPRVQPALQLARFDARASGEFGYQYRLVGPKTRGLDYSTVFLDITSPRTAAAPTMTGTRGIFLFDGMARNPEPDSPYSHPPVFVGTPLGPWVGAIWRQGSVAWLASRYGDGRHAGVAAGGELLGFELRSPAVPALRKFSVVPYQHIPGVDYATGDGPRADPDTTFVIAVGATLGPGWMLEEVTGVFLEMQVAVACETYLLARCPSYRLLVGDLQRAEGLGDAAYGAALRTLRQQVQTDRGSDPLALRALGYALDALDRRPPSRRRPLTAPAPGPRRPPV